jgi:adenylylsulfate kinase
MKGTMGKVCWITGLAGAGKTTIGKAVYKKLKEKNDALVLLDGDELRSIFGMNSEHSYTDRERLAMQYGRLCKALSQQGIVVICCTIGMIESARRWNYSNIDKFMEVYINTPMPVLEQRDQKGLYSGAKNGKIKDVMGVDIVPEPPEMPEIEFVNDGHESVDAMVSQIIDKFENL